MDYNQGFSRFLVIEDVNAGTLRYSRHELVEDETYVLLLSSLWSTISMTESTALPLISAGQARICLVTCSKLDLNQQLSASKSSEHQTIVFLLL